MPKMIPPPWSLAMKFRQTPMCGCFAAIRSKEGSTSACQEGYATGSAQANASPAVLPLANPSAAPLRI